MMEILLDRKMPYQDQDVQVVRQIAAGDAEALRTLYAAYGQRLYAYALRLTSDPVSAEEVLQESLVAVWQGARRFRGEGRVLAWLLGIVHHKALSARRTIQTNLQRNQALETGEDEGTEVPDGAPLPDEQAAQHEQRTLIAAGLERLSLEHRMVLELVFYQGLSLNEVAEVCECPLGTIKSRLNYAKASLRGLLNREGLQVEDVE